MPSNIPFMPPNITEFVDRNNANRQTAAEAALSEMTASLSGTITVMKGAERQHVKVMEISPGESHFLTMLTRLLARENNHKGKTVKALDVGTFTGRSAGALAKGMIFGGKVFSCDYILDYKDIAQNYWKEERVAELVHFVCEKADQTMQNFLDDAQAETFDIIFIDADKTGYHIYYEKALQLLRPGGLVILDNMLWSGKVADDQEDEANTKALRELCEKVSKDERVDHVLLACDDGIMIGEKR